MAERAPATTLLRLGDRPTAIEVRGFALEITAGPDAPKTVRGEKRSLLLGTHPSSEVELTDPHVSRLHARLDVEDTDYVLRDLGSTNGTRVGGTRIVQACLDDGAIIELGATRIRFRLLDEPFEIPLAEEDRFEGLIGRSVAMREMFALCARVAPTDAPVIIQGETGTGKELVARAIHQRSRRSGKPAAALGCSVTPAPTLESQ